MEEEERHIAESKGRIAASSVIGFPAGRLCKPRKAPPDVVFDDPRRLLVLGIERDTMAIARQSRPDISASKDILS